MSYPPTNPGYPAPQPPGYGPPSYQASYQAPAAGPSRLPVYLTAAVVVFGLAAYLASFGPLLTINTDIGPFGGAEFTASGLSYWTVAGLLSALLAAVSLLPRGARAAAGRPYTAIIAVSAVLAVLLVVAQVINRPVGFSIGWALWLVLVFTVLQVVAAVTALLFETGVLTAPAPRPRYEQYGQYGPTGSYYPGVPGPQGAPRPGYPTPYGAYPPDSTNTPPSGFPSFSPAQSPPSPPSPMTPAPEPSSGSGPDANQS